MSADRESPGLETSKHSALIPRCLYSVRNWAKLLPVWGSPLSAAGGSVMNPISNFPSLVRKSVKFFQDKGLPQKNCQEGAHPTRRPGTLGLSLSTVVRGWLANVSLSYVCLALLLATIWVLWHPFAWRWCWQFWALRRRFAWRCCCAAGTVLLSGKRWPWPEAACAMVLLLSRHAGQSQGAAKLRREDLRMVRLMDTAFFWIQVLRWTFHLTFQKLAWIPRILESGNDSMWIDPVTHLWPTMGKGGCSVPELLLGVGGRGPHSTHLFGVGGKGHHSTHFDLKDVFLLTGLWTLRETNVLEPELKHHAIQQGKKGIGFYFLTFSWCMQT